MKCIRNKNHAKTSEICQECLKELHFGPRQPDVRDLEPDLRALFSQLTLQNRDLADCWSTSYSRLKIFEKYLKIQNVYYAFYKADLANEPLRKLCITQNCVNPAHYTSKYEPPLRAKYLKTAESSNRQ
jgi:hypothetical protein